jgi:hypothetical protein
MPVTSRAEGAPECLPQVPFVVFNAAAIQESDVFFLKCFSSMMLNLVLNVLRHGSNL